MTDVLPAVHPLVHARGLTMSYPSGTSRGESNAVLGGIDLTIERPGMTAIIGPSGSGKSTLLMCLSGLERPTGGEVRLQGTDLRRARRGRVTRLFRREVGFVFQAYNLVPYLSAGRNAALPGLLDHRPGALREAAAALESLEMSDLLRTPARLLSGGQQQRVALARALAQKPAVLFADEPTGALDSASSRLVMELLRGAADDGAAVVVVTHDLDAAAAADRVLLLRDGRIGADLGAIDALDLALRIEQEGAR